MISLYAPFETNFSTLGETVLTPESCVVTAVAGGRWDLTLTHPMTEDGRWQHLRVDALLKVAVPVTPASADAEAVQATPQLFRVNTVTVDTAAQRVTAEAAHVSYDLGFCLTGECDLTEATAPLTEELEMIREAMIGDYPGRITTTLTGTWQGDAGWQNPVRVLLDPETGIVPGMKAQVLRDNWDWTLLPNEPVDRDVRVCYGKNLLGLTWTTSTAGVMTRIVPVSTRGGVKTLLPEVVVEAESGSLLPRTALLEAGSGLTEAELRTAAQKAIDGGCTEVVPEIAVDFIMLGDTEEYAAYKDLQKVFLYDLVHVSHEPTGLETAAQVCGYEWDVLLQRYRSITLGSPFKKAEAAIAGYELPGDVASAAKIARALAGCGAFWKSVKEAGS